jgi:uncharacterized protein
MNYYRFKIKGHKNILSNHKNTLEFTKDNDLTKRGDCIVGVSSNFSFFDFKDLLIHNKLKIIIKINDIVEEINSIVNKNFNSDYEIVIRRSDFISDRTLGIMCDKSSYDLDRNLIELLKDENNLAEVELFFYD